MVNHALGNFYASGSIGDVHEEMGPVKSEWWELLFFLKKLEGKQQQEACDIIQTAINVEVGIMKSLLLVRGQASIIVYNFSVCAIFSLSRKYCFS